MSRIPHIVSVEVSLLKTEPVHVAVTAIGFVPTPGWKSPELSAWAYINPPADGIYDFDFIATRPPGEAIQKVTPIGALQFFADPPKGFVGVRVHGTTNNIEARVEGAQAKEIKLPGLDKQLLGIMPWPGVDS